LSPTSFAGGAPSSAATPRIVDAYAGYGMNAGSRTRNLAWLLAAYLQGWADIAILDAYESRAPSITEQVSRFAMEMAGRC